uniref:Uncharacterized protein n=1 Tax=Anguilla anguilla TaxID=7936 RepID=A0A0E9WNX2_ANGAN
MRKSNLEWKICRNTNVYTHRKTCEILRPKCGGHSTFL